MSRLLTAALLALTPLPLALPTPSRGEAPDRHEFRRRIMGTEARIVLWAPGEETARKAAAGAFERMLAVEAVASDWSAASELSRVGDAAGRAPVPVGDDLFALLARSLEIAEASGGAFDPTVGPLTRLWRARSAEGRLPGTEELAHARALVDWRGLTLDAEQRTAFLERAGMRLDLGGVAKGYACDVALAELAAAGCPRALVELGGDLVAGERPPDADGWRVRVDCEDGGTRRELVLERRAAATSGDRFQHTDAGGERYSHVLDPRTGIGLTTGLCATVVAPDGATADALASAVSVLGPAAGRALVARFPGARLLARDTRVVELFDGRTLNGWTTAGGRYDGHASWSVEEGVLVGRTGPGGAGGLLYTEKAYTSFDLELEVLVEPPFDSGLFVRMVPRERGLKGAQITLDEKPEGEIAGIYSDGWLRHNPEGRRAWKRGRWNRLRVRCTGFDLRLEVWINGEHALDYRLPANTPGYAPGGLIGLQVHPARRGLRNAVRFRHLRLRELPLFGERFEPVPDRPGVLRPAAADREEGWRALLDPELSAWEKVGPREGYRFSDGVLAFPASTESGYLRTRRDFRDFRLRVDFALESMANSGLFLRGDREGGDPAFSGCEIQILDDFHWEAVTGVKLKPWQLCGSLYGSVPAGDHGALRPIGAWNTFEVLYRGSRLAVALNGHTLYDVNTLEVPGDPPFARRAPTGFLGLQRYPSPQAEGDTSVRFRNVLVQPLGE